MLSRRYDELQTPDELVNEYFRFPEFTHETTLGEDTLYLHSSLKTEHRSTNEVLSRLATSAQV